jgi:hypothetical protein
VLSLIGDALSHLYLGRQGTENCMPSATMDKTAEPEKNLRRTNHLNPKVEAMMINDSIYHHICDLKK